MSSLLMARRPSHPDVSTIPTPHLQKIALFLTFFFPALSILSVALRAFSRLRTRQWGLDDWLILAALIFAVLMCPPFYMDIKLSYIGWEAKDVPEFDPSPGRWWFYLAQLFYNPVLALVKASILVFLLRLGSHQRWIRWFIYGLNTFNALQAIAVFLVALLQCIPISANWDAEAAATATCVDTSFHVAISCLTILTDIIVLIALMGVFTLGLAVLIIAIVRLVQLYQLFYSTPDPNADPYHNIGITLNTVEVNLAIICACGPALRPLFKSWFPALFGGSTGQYGISGNKGTHPLYGDGGISHLSGTHRHTTATGGPSIALKSLRGTRGQHTECRSISPSGSEEEIMTYNGILRTTQVKLHYENDSNSAQSDSKSNREVVHAS
ncbi:unnamed protein product [Parascedosporium putredinis]|uniref:Rhodopsin domain-containing protein n=1 Tax=Parascedosporium putredinis TaxID=1442378 RepID=A0A9P1GZT9_9PEZI|nr:unnamed protein product [Parascedosporium putredinis]CAI7991111.1 unnamed protein product [Parascedosporium putredinis]